MPTGSSTTSSLGQLPSEDLADRMAGLLLGQAVGDAMGLPREGISPRRAKRLFGGRPLKHRLILGRGMCSDDTEHACMVAVALLRSGADPKRFARSLAWQMRGWFASLPAGMGMATAKACIKLWLGFPTTRSGVWSAGNGPAMRATVLGAAMVDRPGLLREMIRISTQITHTDPKAQEGALAVALATAWSIGHGGKVDSEAFFQELLPQIKGEELARNLAIVQQHLVRQEAASDLATAMGLSNGVSGYINHTVPAALFCWLREGGDYQRAVESVIELGGDTDTTGAIVGGIVGAGTGVNGIPAAWVDGLLEWPRTIPYLQQLAHALAAQMAGGTAIPIPRWFWPGVIVRNLVFLLIVLGHGVRRLFPPY